MKYPRHELVRGIIVLGMFLALIVSVSLLRPYSSSHSGYTSVDIETLAEGSTRFEGKNVTSSTSITNIFGEDSHFVATTSDGILLVFPSTLAPPEKGNHVIFRGKSWILLNNSISVHFFHVHQSYSSIIRSLPGIVLFTFLYFAVFSIDFEKLAFVVRR